MNIKIDLNVNAPEIVSAIEKLTAVIPVKISSSLVKNTETIQKENTATKKFKSKFGTSETPAITLEQVRTKLATLAQSGKQESVKKLIQKYGGSKLSEIDPMNYENLLKDAEEIQ